MHSNVMKMLQDTQGCSGRVLMKKLYLMSKDTWHVSWKFQYVTSSSGIVLWHHTCILYRFQGNPLDTCQQVILFGCGVPKFNAAWDAIASVYKLFATNYAEGTFCQICEPIVGELLGLEFCTCYFTNPRIPWVAEDVPIPSMIDLHGVLQSCLTNRGFHHTLENAVSYRQHCLVMDGKNSCVWQVSIFHIWS
jgi:hypothetical protein